MVCEGLEEVSELEVRAEGVNRPSCGGPVQLLRELGRGRHARGRTYWRSLKARSCPNMGIHQNIPRLPLGRLQDALLATFKLLNRPALVPMFVPNFTALCAAKLFSAPDEPWRSVSFRAASDTTTEPVGRCQPSSQSDRTNGVNMHDGTFVVRFHDGEAFDMLNNPLK